MVNKTVLQGRLTADPEIKQTPSMVALCEFTVAWSEKYKEEENKCFLRCKAWRQTAEFLGKYFVKGQELVVEGQLRTEEWDKDGKRQSRTILMVDKLHFCGKRHEGQAQAAKSAEAGFAQVEDEELPF